MRRLVARVRSSTHFSLLANATTLVGTTGMTSVLGFFYWSLAARLFPTDAVGLGGASVSAMVLLGTVGMLGLGTLLIRELPRHPGKEARLIATAVLVAGPTGAGLGLLFALLAPVTSPNLQPLAASAGTVALFAAGAGITAATMVLDYAVIGLLRGELQFWRNFAYAVVKLIVLVPIGIWYPAGGGMTIFATWVVGNGASLVALLALVARRGGRVRACRPEWRLLQNFGVLALKHHALNLSLQAPSFALPIVVTTVLSTTANAYFYAAWMIGGFVFMGPLALATALYAAGSHAPNLLGHRLRLTLPVALGLGVLANAGLFVASDLVLRLFGPDYAQHGRWPLQIIGLSVFPLIIKDHFVTIRQIDGRLGDTAAFLAVGGVLELIAAALGAGVGGLSGLALAVLLAQCLEALIMLRPIYRAAKLPAAAGPLPHLERAVERGPGIAAGDAESTLIGAQRT